MASARSARLTPGRRVGLAPTGPPVQPAGQLQSSPSRVAAQALQGLAHQRRRRRCCAAACAAAMRPPLEAVQMLMQLVLELPQLQASNRRRAAACLCWLCTACGAALALLLLMAAATESRPPAREQQAEQGTGARVQTTAQRSRQLDMAAQRMQSRLCSGYEATLWTPAHSCLPIIWRARPGTRQAEAGDQAGLASSLTACTAATGVVAAGQAAHPATP